MFKVYRGEVLREGHHTLLLSISERVILDATCVCVCVCVVVRDQRHTEGSKYTAARPTHSEELVSLGKTVTLCGSKL